MESLWRKQTKDILLKTDKGLNQDDIWDVIVIGAGMAGLLTAYYLKEQGKNSIYWTIFLFYSEFVCCYRISKMGNDIAAVHNLLADIRISIKGLARGFFYHAKDKAVSLSCGQGGIVEVDEKTYACYRDEKGKLHRISHRCAHMGCELVWNPNEKSWDCPCHGSRYDVDGKLLDNPSKKSVE